MLRASIEITGRSMDDLLLALEEVRVLMQRGNLSGVDANDDGTLCFTIVEEEEITE